MIADLTQLSAAMVAAAAAASAAPPGNRGSTNEEQLKLGSHLFWPQQWMVRPPGPLFFPQQPLLIRKPGMTSFNISDILGLSNNTENEPNPILEDDTLDEEMEQPLNLSLKPTDRVQQEKVDDNVKKKPKKKSKKKKKDTSPTRLSTVAETTNAKPPKKRASKKKAKVTDGQTQAQGDANATSVANSVGKKIETIDNLST